MALLVGGVIAYVTAESPTAQSIRRDLQLSSDTSLWIEANRNDRPDRALAVTRRDGRYKIFLVVRRDGVIGKWHVFGEPGCCAPEGQPEAIWEYADTFDQYPSRQTIAEYSQLLVALF